jgi:hypothetical protein
VVIAINHALDHRATDPCQSGDHMKHEANGLLLAGFDYSSVAADEFNEWYDTEHLPERRRVPGFMNCERWAGAENDRIAIATYDLQSLEVLNSAAYQAIAGKNLSPWSKRVTAQARRLCRFEAQQLGAQYGAGPQQAGGLMMYAMNVVPEAEAEFNAWYDEEHIPRLSAVPGCLLARRFKIVNAISDGRQRYLALYHLTRPDICSSEKWKEAAHTEWTSRMRPNFRDGMRIVLRRYQPES